MATPDGKKAGGTETDLTERAKPGFLERLRFAVTGEGGKAEWFGPGAPLPASAPPDVAGRAFDYATNANLGFTPRGESGESPISFLALRRLSEPSLGGFDLVRVAIETRKDQMASLRWTIKGRDKRIADGGPRARSIESALRRPDGVNTFATWQRMVLEDMLVIDAPSVYINRTRGKPKLPPPAKPPAKPKLGPDGKPLPAPGEEGRPGAFGAQAEGSGPGPTENDDAASPQSDPEADPGEPEGEDGAERRPFGKLSKAGPPWAAKRPGEEDGEEGDEAAEGSPPEGESGEEPGEPGEEAAGETGPAAPADDDEGGTPKVEEAPVSMDTADDVGVLLEVVDGATLKKLLREDGRTPLPPEPAYVQNLKGMPAVHYTCEELLYAPRNVRSHRAYGYSPVEQILTTINIALRRQLSQLEYYTAGSVPDMMLGVPETWTLDQIKAFQAWFDVMLTGDTAERRKVRFIPGGTSAIPTKDPKVKDEWDEWLARLVCYAFSLSPQALVQQMNRATAETAEEQSLNEGLEPLKLWFKDMMDLLLTVAFDSPELEFAWQDEEINDPRVKSDVWTALVGAKIATQNEARDAYGFQPVDGGDEFGSPAPPPTGAFGGGPPLPFGGGPPGKPGGGAQDHPPDQPPPGAPVPPGLNATPEKLAALIARELQKKKTSLRSLGPVTRRPSRG